MSDEDFAIEIGSILTPNKEEIINSILDLVRRKLEDSQPPCATEIIQAIENSGLVHRMMCDWSNRWVANEVGNRLRCGIWNGSTVDRLFDSIWTEQFDIAIRDRIRQRVYSAIDGAIKERLVSMQPK